LKSQVARYLVLALAFFCLAFFSACAIESNGEHDAGPTDEGGQTDEDTGGDETICDDECPTAGQTCDGNGYRVCEDTDGDGCLELSDLTECAASEECNNGECGIPCIDDCMIGAVRCVPDTAAYETCDNHDDDPCREWGGQVTCETGKVCELGVCVCENSCQFGLRRCADGTQGYETCADHNSDGCLEWGGLTECRTGLQCDEGQCVVECTDACDTGDSRCVDNASEVCGDFDDDPCLDWGAHTECAAGAACEGGQCVCSNLCTLGEQRCAGAEAYEVCGDLNGDQCPEWGSLTQCTALEYCDNGQCIPICTDQCTNQGEVRCLDGIEGYESCDDHNGDNCIEWGGQVLCDGGFLCDAGSCVCSYICEVGEYRCVGGGVEAYEVCDDHNGDDCPEWGGQVDCDPGLNCVEGAGRCCPPYPDGPYGTGMGSTVENECLERVECNGSTPIGTVNFCFDEFLCKKAIMITIHTGW
jgi:hypothetical protein